MSKADKEKGEIRTMVDKDVLTALDAIAMASGQTMTAVLVEIIDEFVFRKLHETSVIQRVMQGNPLLAEADRTSRGV